MNEYKISIAGTVTRDLRVQAIRMWRDMGVQAALDAPSPDELDAERTKPALGGLNTADADGEANG